MASTFIATTARGSFNAMRFQGILVTDTYTQLAAMLEKALPRDRVLFFAEPVHESSGAATDWYTDAEGPLVPFTELPPKDRERAGARIAAIASDIHALAGQLQSDEDPSKKIRGGILSLALCYPGPEHIYMAGDQPVLICWGFGPGTRGAQPEDLMRLGTALPVASVTVAAKPLEENAASASPLASAGTRAGTFPWLRALLFFLLGLLFLAALFFLTGLLFGPSGPLTPPASGCSPAISPVSPETPAPSGADTPLISLMTAEQEKERSLRGQLEDLRRRLAEKAGQCARTPAPLPDAPKPPEKDTDPPVAEVPDTPPSLAELMPTTPDPPPPPAPKPALKPETPPAPEEKPKKQTRGEDLRIPESAKKNNDMSFLEGCWDSDSGLVSLNSGEPITVQYCFDANGNGTRTVVKQQSNDRCVGPVRTRFDALGNLHIEADAAACRRGGGFVPQQVECTQGAGSRADCYGREKGGKRNKWNARFRRT